MRLKIRERRALGLTGARDNVRATDSDNPAAITPGGRTVSLESSSCRSDLFLNVQGTTRKAYQKLPARSDLEKVADGMCCCWR